MIPTQDQVKHVAKLARLNLTADELALYQGQLADIFGLFDKLNEIDVSSVDKPRHASREQMTMRKDEITMTDDAEKLLAVTHQEVIGGHIAIPAIMRKK